MKILKLSIRFWQWCGVYLPASSTAVDFYLSLLSIFVLLSGLLAFLWLSIGYIVTERNNVELSQLFYAVMEICANSVVLGPYASALLVRGSIRKMIELLQKVVGERTKSQRLYESVERKTNLLAKWPIILCLCLFGGIKIITVIGYGIRDLIRGAFDSSKYYNLLRVSSPVDLTTILGYITYSFLEVFIIAAYYLAYCSNITLFISLCLYLEALCADFGEIYHHIDHLAVTRRQNVQEMKPYLTDAINFQANINTLFEHLKSISSGMLFATQLSSAVFISCSIFQVDAASQSFDTNFIILLCVLVVAVFAVLPCCYFASRITAKLNQTADEIYFSAWRSLPIEQQKYIPFMIAFAQRDHTFRGMNMIPCSLESFVQILRASASYYLMIKKL